MKFPTSSCLIVIVELNERKQRDGNVRKQKVYVFMKESWKENSFIVLSCIIMAILFYSSSMSYGQQSVTPTLNRFLAGEPFKKSLSKIQFLYAGEEISIHAYGYSGFIEFFLRKGAHFFSYFLLGLSWFMGLKDKVENLFFAIFLSFLLAAGYASFDEFHQGLTPGRTPLLQDILLDCAGASTGILMSWFFVSTFPKRKRKNRRRV